MSEKEGIANKRWEKPDAEKILKKPHESNATTVEQKNTQKIGTKFNIFIWATLDF